MAAFDLDGWLKQHGGEAEAVPLQQGDVEHRAQDGSYVVIRRDGTSAMVGFRPPGESSPQPAAPSAVQPPGGSGMDKQALEALLAQIAPNGDPLRLVYTQTTKPVKVTVPGEGLTGKPTTKTVNLLVHQWVDPGTGQVLVAEQGQDGTYTVTKQGIDQSAVGKPPAAATAQAEPPKEKDENGRHWVWQPNPGGPAAGGQWIDSGPSAQKPAEPPKERVDPADPTKRQTWNPQANGGQGAWEDAGAVAQPDKPKYGQVRQDEQTGKWFGLTPSGQWEEIQGGPNAAPGKKYVQVVQDKDTGKWHGLTAQGTWEELQGGPGTTPQGAPTSMSTPTGPVGPVTTWLQAETEKLAKQAAEENWTRERFDAEVKRRLDFAHQLVAENTATQAQENATADRVAANQRQAMSTSGGIATSIAPGMIKQGGEFLPGNGRVATEGLMAMLGMLGQYTQRASQQAGNAAGRTTISPDGTITVQHVPAGSAPPAQPAQDQADAAVRHAQAAAGVNTLGSAGTDPVFRPAPPTDVQPAAAGPDFTDPTTGQFGIPGSFSTGPYGAVPDWMQQQATQAVAPSGGDANEYLGMVGQDDPSWQAALAEANRRRSMSMAGAA